MQCAASGNVQGYDDCQQGAALETSAMHLQWIVESIASIFFATHVDAVISIHRRGKVTARTFVSLRRCVVKFESIVVDALSG